MAPRVLPPTLHQGKSWIVPAYELVDVVGKEAGVVEKTSSWFLKRFVRLPCFSTG